jgi:hypothetical protein
MIEIIMELGGFMPVKNKNSGKNHNTRRNRIKP